MERLIKNALGQWKILKQNTLNKAWVDDESQSTPARKLAQTHPTLAHAFYGKGPRANFEQQMENRKKLDGMFKGLKDAYDGGSSRAVDHHLANIRGLVSSTPTGQIDLGHLSKKQDEIAGHIAPMMDSGKLLTNSHNTFDRYSHNDLLHAFDKHLGDIDSLKELHDEHGEDAVAGIARAHGSHIDYYGDTAFKQHTNLKDKNNLLGDVHAFINGAYGHHANIVPSQTDHAEPYFEWAPGGSHDPDNEKNGEAVTHAWHQFLDNDATRSASRDFDNAVVKRGMSNFKHAHGIPK
jgi:hypothetical protein